MSDIAHHCSERQSHHIVFYYQQRVSDIAHFIKGTHITSCLKTNSLWVTLHILWKAVPSHLFPCPTECKWHCTSNEGSLFISFPMINRKWVTLHILWKAVHHIFLHDWQLVSDILWKVASLHLFLWPMAGSEWYCTVCEWEFHHFFSYDQTASEWYCTLCDRECHLLIWWTVCEWHSKSSNQHSQHPTIHDISLYPMYIRMWASCHNFYVFILDYWHHRL